MIALKTIIAIGFACWFIRAFAETLEAISKEGEKLDGKM